MATLIDALTRSVDRWWREAARCLGVLPQDPATRRMAAGLGAAAMGLVGLHVYTMLSLRDGGIDDWTMNPEWLRLDRDHSVSELLEYLLTLGAALLAVRGWRLTRQPIYLGLAAVFLVMVVDNALMLHERTALTLVDRGWLPGLLGEAHPHARGELVYFLTMGSGLAGLVALAFRRSGFAHRVRGLILLAPVGVAVLFGVGVDYLKRFVEGPPWLGYALTLVEDGGELLAIVLLAVVTLGVVHGLSAADCTAGRRAARPYPAGAMALGSPGGRSVRTGPGRR